MKFYSPEIIKALENGELIYRKETPDVFYKLSNDRTTLMLITNERFRTYPLDFNDVINQEWFIKS